MNFTDYRSDTAREIDLMLESVITSWKDEFQSTTPTLLPLVEIFAKSGSGGKRLRGTLTRLGYEIAGGRDNQAIIKPAVACEILQTSILAHDDIIDKSTLRRGKPSLHTALGGDHYAISQTISLGDYGFFLCLNLIATSNFPENLKIQALDFFTKSILKTAQGEMFDVLLPTNTTYTESDILQLSRLKTASYTFYAPLCLGATLGGADGVFLNRIHEFSEQLGIAFQLHDDLLGIFGSEKAMGKSSSSDISEGKVTMLIAYIHQRGSSSEKEVLSSLYGKPDLTPEEINRIKALLKQSGAKAYIQDQIQKYTINAKKMIEVLTESAEIRNTLSDMTTYLLDRKS